MSDTTPHTPADVRERVAKIVREAMEDARRSERLNTFLQSSMWDYTDRILALIRTPRGEGERVTGAWATVEAAALAQANVLDSHYGGQPAQAAEIREAVEQVAALLCAGRGEGEASGLAECITCMGCGQEFDPDDDTQSRYHEAACEVVDYEPARVEIARRLRDAALRDGAHGEAKFDVGDPAALRLAASKLEASGYDVLALRLRKIADQIKCVIAARRSKAQVDAEALAALIVHIWTRCKDEGPHYRETEEFWEDFERAYQLALLRTPRGEGEAEALAWRIEYRGKTSNGWHYQSTCDSLKEAEEKVMRLRRGGVPLEYRIVPLYPAARRGEGGGDG